MYRLSRLRYVFPLGLFAALFLDGSLSKIFAGFFFHYPYAMVSQLVIVWLVCSYFFEGDIQIPLIGFSVVAGIFAISIIQGSWDCSCSFIQWLLV